MPEVFMTGNEKIVHEVNVESVQRSIDNVVRATLEFFYNRTIMCCGFLFDHPVEDLTFDLVKSSLVEATGNLPVVILKIEISKSKILKETSEGNFPLTYVKVWYYLNQE